MNDYAILTEALTRNFKTVCAVDDISLQVPAGTIFGFLGPNGAGKTTTIRLLLGLLEPTAGSATVLGFDTRTQADDIRQRCGALLEHPGLYERLSAADNLEFYARVWRMPSSQRTARIQELLTAMGLWDRRHEAVGTWSRGMKQKLAVARTLLHRPLLVFLDEPTAGLDPLAAAALRDDLASLAEREGVTVFLTTHNLAEAEKLCQQVGLIRQGKLLASGPLAELRRRGNVPRLEITGSQFSENAISLLRQRPDVAVVQQHNSHLSIELTGECESAPLVGLLVGAGVQVEEVHRSQASLEQVFLSLMGNNDAG
jgi:ABC-2 type transport system ATP-binding protein